LPEPTDPAGRAAAQVTQAHRSVERADGSSSYEFYGVHDLPKTLAALNPLIDSFQHLYNHYPPKGAFQYLAVHHGLDPHRPYAMNQNGRLTVARQLC
jgi:hypothetical protein